ncbi:hypothetical protein SAMN05428976_1245 [Clostridium sp. USBA 49]|nr:hypothetical protein SAMN05428976_1245 [Clostridium sp. USBA 49]
MIKDINAYHGIYKLSDCKKTRITKQDIDKIINFIKDCKLNTDNIYIDTSSLSNDVPYYFDGTFLNMINYSLINKEKMHQPSVMELLRNPNVSVEETQYDYYKREFTITIENYLRNYEKGEIYFPIIDKKLYPLLYGIFFDKMSSDEKHFNFLRIYKECEYPQTYFSTEDIKNIASMIPKYIIDKRKDYSIVKNEYINVYRGQESLSSTGEGAISWTTDIKIAKFFASRFEEKGVILSGRVHIKDIIAIFDKEYYEDGDSDPEKEILVYPNSVTDIKIIKYSR